MKSLQAPDLKTTALTKVIYAAIHSYDEQTFENMSEESEKNFIVKKYPLSLCLVPSQGMVKQAKKHGGFRPQRGNPGNALRPQRVRWLMMHLIKDIIKYAVNYLALSVVLGCQNLFLFIKKNRKEIKIG